jgi:ABC-type dipeptide/oligopeptide/nickel transport system ATPase component
MARLMYWVIEQNIGVACAIADTVAIMVNGRINRSAPARELAADRELQQRLLGVGRHGHEDIQAAPATSAALMPETAPATMVGRSRSTTQTRRPPRAGRSRSRLRCWNAPRVSLPRSR